MNISAIPITSGAPYTIPLTLATGAPTVSTQQQETANKNNSSNSQAEYQAAAKAAAAASFNYPLGTKEFSLYKDVTGQFITRYVSLIDGSVTYVPTPVYIKPQSVAMEV